MKLLFCILAISCFTFTAKAGEPLFGYVYTTDTAPAGHFELEQRFTLREGQANGYFHHLDMATEVEYGVTDNFQIALYLNYMYADESANSVDGLTEGVEIPWYHDPHSRYNEVRFDGISFEALYRVLSPYTDAFGLAFYLEPEIGYYEQGLEFRSIAQKNFYDDQVVLAANFWVELDREQGTNLVVPGSGDIPDGSWNKATYAELDLGASYRFRPNWTAGLEFRNHNEYQGHTLAHSEQDHSAFFFGPNIHYASQHFFATFAMLRQIGTAAYSDDQKAEIKNNLLYGDEHTAWDGIRLIIGAPL